MAKVLVIDDDRMMCELLCRMAGRLGHEGVYAETLGEGLTKATSEPFDIVFLDVRLPDGNGLDILPRIRETATAPEVIIITGAGDPDGAELAIRSGAWDYIQKPASNESIRLPFTRALEFRKHKAAESRSDKDRTGVVALKREAIIGNCPKIKACLDVVAQAATSDANVLISGETGTGKELFAWAIHENSPRANKPFVIVDCAALTDSLVESVLFGHEKGAFTGADKAQSGMIRQADGGTLMLDEVGELPLTVQKAFLRVLQERRFRPVGGKDEVQSDFRLIAATNRDLDLMVKEGYFRKDLFFRIRSFAIELPPLRERQEDIRELVLYQMAKLSERYGIDLKGLSPEFLDAVSRYDWPGNVRELVHAMEIGMIAARPESTLFPDHLPVHIRVQVARSKVLRHHATTGDVAEVADFPKDLPKLQDARETAIDQVEKHYLQRLVALTRTNLKEACRIAGLSRSQLYTLLRKHGITRGD